MTRGGYFERGPRLVAHRGVPALAPENSAASLVHAREHGALVVELDARLTMDGLFVVVHDETAERMTGRTGPVAAATAAELIDAPLIADPASRLLLLDEALALLAGRTTVDIELKPAVEAPAAVAEALVRTLERAGSPRDLVVTSEDAELLETLKRLCPLIPTGLVYRSADDRDAAAVASAIGASLIVANRTRCDAALLRDCRARALGVWAYTVNDCDDARDLLVLGCDAVVTDDFPRLAAGLAPPAASRDEPPGPTVLVIDLGSSSIKALLVDPGLGVVERRSVATPLGRPAPGRFEHDAEALLGETIALLDALAESAPRAPAVAAIASQRSTGLWAHSDSLRPLTPAVSWRDRRGESVVRRLEPERARLERAARLPLAPAWTAVAGTALAAECRLGDSSVLTPLGSWVAARLTGLAPRVDPTLANRTFLARPDGTAWSRELLSAFGLVERQLPRLAPTVSNHGALAWPGGGAVPLRVLVGDQQAAYVGAAGPSGRRLVINVGTGGFVMRAAEAREPVPQGGRIAPLWTSDARREPPLYLLEIPVLGEADQSAADADSSAMSVARATALGSPGPAAFARRIASGTAVLGRHRERTVVVSGGVLASPHMLKLLGDALALPLLRAGEPELTGLGAARLAAAAIRAPWSVPPAGGLQPLDAPRV